MPTKRRYQIINRKTGLHWNNETGWGDKASATVFTEEQKGRVNLPIEGVWIIKTEQRDRYCPKCGQHFAVHNDDGSCVKD